MLHEAVVCHGGSYEENATTVQRAIIPIPALNTCAQDTIMQIREDSSRKIRIWEISQNH